mmetsp:Transcript_21375/g.31817  ORF Transcript_21375/g.31817 Transcript_21375/m.31817 type:complete len:273 (+) Transcript_21375:238-1056(+)
MVHNIRVRSELLRKSAGASFDEIRTVEEVKCRLSGHADFELLSEVGRPHELFLRVQLAEGVDELLVSLLLAVLSQRRAQLRAVQNGEGRALLFRLARGGALADGVVGAHREEQRQHVELLAVDAREARVREVGDHAAGEAEHGRGEALLGEVEHEEHELGKEENDQHPAGGGGEEVARASLRLVRVKEEQLARIDNVADGEVNNGGERSKQLDVGVATADRKPEEHLAPPLVVLGVEGLHGWQLHCGGGLVCLPLGQGFLGAVDEARTKLHL